MWSELRSGIDNPIRDCDTHTAQKDPRRSQGTISDTREQDRMRTPQMTSRDNREQVEVGHSWDSLAMPPSIQPGKMIRWKDRDINTPQDIMRTPQMTSRDNREQVEVGHSWDSLAMSASIQPGKKIRCKDRDINTPLDSMRTRTDDPTGTIENRLLQDIAGTA